ncbi:hypothetical protein E5D57_002252 [Metarhizium anisopliae]|nr:hypothetical protein E5D57_002252 [Metarhizium anisopliae]
MPIGPVEILLEEADVGMRVGPGICQPASNIFDAWQMLRGAVALIASLMLYINPDSATSESLFIGVTS